MRSRCALAFVGLCALLAVAGQAHAQAPTGSVIGRVVDSANTTPIAVVRVMVNGTTHATATGDDGRYTLSGLPAGAITVRFTRLGFAPVQRSVTVTPGQPVTLNVTMGRSAVELAEMVSIGYGSQRRVDLTGAISTVGSEDLSKTIVSSLEQGLQGRVPGVQVTQGDAAPGGGVRIQVRGVNSMNSGSAQPLFVIDGVPFQESGISKRQIGATSEENLSSLTETNPLSSISPNEIESIDILKDASATAIYGSRGANGVVIVTTKRGRAGRGTTTASYSQGASSVANRYDLLNAFDYANYVNQSYINIGQADNELYCGGCASRPGSLSPDSIRKLVGNGTDWQDEIFRTSMQRDANLTFSSADGAGNDYLLSGSLLDQQGVIKGSEFRRGGFRTNINRSLFSDRVQVSGNVGVTQSINNMVRTSTINGYRAVGAVRQALTYTPFQIRDSTNADPRAEDPLSYSTLGANPLRYTDEVKERDAVTRGIGGLRGVVALAKGLSADVSLSGNYEARAYENYFPRTVGEGAGNNGDANQAHTDLGSLLNENLLRYAQQFGNQHVDLIGGYTTQYNRSSYQAQEVRSFPDDILGSNVMGNGTLVSPPQTGLYIDRLDSWLARGTYSFKDRYVVTGSVRRDGSTKFAENNKWATFPAASVAWRLSEEPFLRGKADISDLKLRLSYGKSGNQAIGPNQSQSAVSGSGCLMALNGSPVSCYRITQLGNNDLKWETTTQTDAGADLGLFDNRVTATFDYYDKQTDNLLQQIQLPTSTGFANAWLNSGTVSNKGVELGVSVDVLQGNSPERLRWSVSANASHNKNEIISLGATKQQFAGRLGAGGNLEVTPFIQKPGYAIGAMWGYQVQGIVKTVEDSVAASDAKGSAQWIGDYRIRDLNGDGHITADDQTIVGDANPTWQFGMNNTFSWKRWDLTAQLTAVRGGDIINAERMTFLVLNGQLGNVPRDIVENSWNPTTNPNGTNQMIRNNRGGFGNQFLDVFVEDGSYVRLKNLQIGYRLPLPKANQARLYLNMVNLWTSTNYSGFDPEVSAFGGTDRPGVDQGSYPASKLFMLGVNLTY